MGDAETCELAVVVVTHDSVRWLPGFFASWEEGGGMRNAECGMWKGEGVGEVRKVRVVVADSGSGDGTVAWARGKGVEVLECGNAGYGAAANRGVRAAGAEWVLVCNPDVTFGEGFGERFLGRVMRGEEGRAGCFGPRLLNEDGTVQASVGRFPSVWGLVRDQFRRRKQRKYVMPQPGESGEVDWVSGACLLFRREAFEAAGGFDEKYFLYVEEVDLMKRMKARGWGTFFVAEGAVVHHAPNASKQPREEVQRWAARGLLRYFAKFGGWFALRSYGMMAVMSGRLGASEGFASRRRILDKATGP